MDKDNDPDVLITGTNSSFDPISKLYTNDGSGQFNEKTGTPFDGVGISSIAFADVDGDKDPDVLITGRSLSGQISKLYLNEGITSSTEDLTLEANLNFILFPNPSAPGTLYLNYDAANAGELVVKVYTITGVLISQQTEFAVSNQQTYSVDVSTLPSGNYLIELDNGSGNGVAQFIIK